MSSTRLAIHTIVGGSGKNAAMSDLLGVLITGGTALHLVDWDRPVWLNPNDMNGLRISPSADFFVADALAVFMHHGLDRCGGTCNRAPGDYNDLGVAPPCEHLAESRQRAYRDHHHPVLFLHAGPQPDVLVLADLLRLKCPQATSPLSERAVDVIGLA